MTFLEHVNHLARQNRISVVVIPDRETYCIATDTHPKALALSKLPVSGTANRQDNAVYIWPHIETPSAYAVALHELGHLCSHLQLPITHGDVFIARMLGMGPPLAMQRNELDAWNWAECAAMTWTPEMQAVKSYALMSYGLAV